MIKNLLLTLMCFAMFGFVTSAAFADKIEISDLLQQNVVTYYACDKSDTLDPRQSSDFNIKSCQSVSVCTGSGCGKDNPDPGGHEVCAVGLRNFPVSAISVVNESPTLGYPKTTHCVYAFR